MAAANQYPLEPKPLPPLAGELVNAPVEATPVLPVPARRETTAHEKLEDAAFRAACAWKLCETNGDLAALEERRKEIEASLRSAVQSAKKIERANFAKWVDSKWLLDNFILFRLCLHDVKATFAGAKDLPQVERGKMRRAPRAYAIAESYLETVDYKFDPKSFSIFVNAAQRDASLTFAEIAMMKAFVQLAMLEKVTEIVNAVFASDAPAIQASAAPAEAENGSTAQPVLPAIVPSFRCIVDMAWRDIFEEVSPVARILREDPAAAYAKMDADGRENYRRVIANLSERSTWDEERIARKAVELAATAQAATTLRGRERRAHAGYYLVDGGLKTLRTVIGYRPKISERFHDAILRWPEIAYLIAIEAITLGIMTAIFSIPGAGFAAVLVAILFFFPVLDCAMSIINLLATLIVPPRRLPRLDFSEGLPPECATMVVVPT
ncbi:MAG TPA: hypothetical protein VEJ39_04650, partial [Candidatus Acidoferrales bacterium]|nr:hypothetical protein [Candidatus Acidoferrales bacterium]